MNSSTSTAVTPSRRATAGYSPISLSALDAVGSSDLDLYICKSENSRPVLLRGKQYADEPLDFDLLRRRGVDRLYLKSSDFTRMQQRLFDNLEGLMKCEEIAISERLSILQTAVGAQIEKSFNLVDSSHAITAAQSIGGQITSLMSESDVLAADVFAVVRHDRLTFTHITNVASYCVLLAKKLGISAHDEQHKIAVGGLLHDMGKRFISPAILNKNGPLSPEERKIIEEHPLDGYTELHPREDFDFGQRMMVYQHHEKMDGTGYPVCITGEEIHPWARLCAIVDVFDALTGERSYRISQSVETAFEIMDEGIGSQFDKEMYACWKHVMHNEIS